MANLLMQVSVAVSIAAPALAAVVLMRADRLDWVVTVWIGALIATLWAAVVMLVVLAAMHGPIPGWAWALLITALAVERGLTGWWRRRYGPGSDRA